MSVNRTEKIKYIIESIDGIEGPLSDEQKEEAEKEFDKLSDDELDQEIEFQDYLWEK